MRSLNGRPKLAWLGMAAVVTLTVVGTSGARRQNYPDPPQTNSGPAHLPASGQAGDGFGSVQEKVMKEQVEKRSRARQQQLVADTVKLLRLANELKAEVDKSNQNTLSVTVIKKSEEIEKLAKSVKDKMKNPL